MAETTYGIVEYYGMVDAPINPTRVEGEEVGDDRVDFSGHPWKLASGLMCQERVSRMVTSQEDTTMSARLWNFCETTSHVPLHPGQSFTRCRKIGEFQDLGFVDVPPLRILLDVMKGDRSHSSTAVGKATMLGSRISTPRSEFLQDFHLASYLQDGYLRTSRSSEPKYLPKIMGGSGVKALFSNPLNLYLYVHAYRGGRCQRIYGSATRELRQSLDTLEKGERVIMPILCRRLRDRQEYLHGTYAEKVFIPKQTWMGSFGDRLPDPLIEASGGANLFASFENRLLRTKHVVTRTGAEREWENSSRIRARLLSRYVTTVEAQLRSDFDRKAARRQFGMALFANTAFAHLLERKASLSDVIQLTNDNFHVVNCGATAFTKWDAEWLFFGGKGEAFTIEDLTSSEDIFLRTEVSEEESMKVGSILLKPIIGRKVRNVLTTTTVGLYEIGTGMYEWAADLAERLVRRRDEAGRPLLPHDALMEYQKDPEWVNDDTLLIARCLHLTGGRAVRSTSVILVSADRRLANQMTNTCNVTVVCIDPRQYILYCAYHGCHPLSEVAPKTLWIDLGLSQIVPEPVVTLLDTGSVNSFLSRTESLTLKNAVLYDIVGSRGGESIDEPRAVTYRVTTVPTRKTVHYRILRPVQRPKMFPMRDPLPVEEPSRRARLSSRSASSSDWRARTG
jgi:hypothetical protein